VSRILILLMFVFWLAWKPEDSWPPVLGVVPSLALFLGVYAAVVLGAGVWSRRLGDRISGPNFGRSLTRFNWVMFVIRVFVPLWFLVGMLALGWWQDVAGLLRTPQADLTQTLAGVVLGTLPALLAWAGLWWSQYPAEIAFREQSLLSQLDADLPVHRPPSFRTYLWANVRLQLLFMVVPVLMIVLLHDLIRLGAMAVVGTRYGLNDAENPFTWLTAAGLIFLVAPEILRRVLHTEPLPNSPLRRRLEGLCRRTGVRYRQILLWRTQNNLGNAAVMGFIPRFRYILLSDLLLETMTDEQIEAVFAHELGHIVHRHMTWLMVFLLVLMLFNLSGGAWVTRWLSSIGFKDETSQGIVIGAAYLFKFLLLFGFVSRRFERQADVFAARTMEMSRRTIPTVAAHEVTAATFPVVAIAPGFSPSGALGLTTLQRPVRESRRRGTLESGHVGQYGATVFGSALQRVAIVNNIPVKARSWCHGSIATRMKYLADLSSDPSRTERFDRFMLFLYGALVFALFAGAAFCYASSSIP
jgi:STE24 endopeptidase